MEQQKGFTLVELAIALSVIGLLLAGVLKGREMIENTRITATIRMLENLQSAVAMFDSTYDSLPGDIEDPEARLPNCNSALCDVSGNGNRRVYWGNAIGTFDPEAERYNFFVHMVKAGFLKGPEGGTTAPENTEKSWANFVPSLPLNNIKIELRYHNNNQTWDGVSYGWAPGHRFESMLFPGNLKYVTGKQMFSIDEKIDDGRPFTGYVAGGRCAEGDWTSNIYDPQKTCEFMMQGRF